MHYPFWYVPFLTSPMLIAVVAVFHIFVALYAVGGGLFLAIETSFAYRRNNRQYLDYLKSHAYFFILVTVVYGAITGVGIWWTISLASPLATEFLIHTFVFGWAMEYVFFILEIVSAFLFFYGWDILPPKIHRRIGWIYAVSAWVSLVLITGILAFMLNPLPWDGGFWKAFLNPQTVPQIIIRTGGSILLAMLYVYVHACIFSKSAHIKELVARRSSYYVAIGALMLLAGGAGWFFTLPQSARVALTSAPALIILSSIIGVLCGILFFIFYLGPYRNPSWMNPAIALVLFSWVL
jgi:cytochrome bd-type quinol oxidase subunit 1